MIPQVSLTRTQFKETSIWDVSSQLMKLQPINIQDATTTVNEVLMFVEISSYGLSIERFRLNWRRHFLQESRQNMLCSTKEIQIKSGLLLWPLIHNRVKDTMIYTGHVFVNE